MEDEAAVPWPDHPLALSDGAILRTKILPLLGDHPLTRVRLGAVCPGWRNIVRAASVGEYALQAAPGQALLPSDDCSALRFGWSPDGRASSSAAFSAVSSSGASSTGTLARSPSRST